MARTLVEHLKTPQREPAAEMIKSAVQTSGLQMDFDEIYKEYGERVLNLTYRMTGSAEVARDLTQDIFIKVYENLGKFEGQSQIYTWIYRIAMNHTLNYLKKSSRHKWFDFIEQNVRDVFREDAIDPTFWGRSGVPQPDKKLEKTEREQTIQKLIHTIPAKHRVPFLLHRYEGMSYNEIAETMGISLSAVETRIHRAKKALIRKLEPIIDQL